MGFYDNWVLPRLIDFACGNKANTDDRVACLKSAHGTVLEVGFGTGHNLPHYPRTVEKVVGVDPCGTSAKLAQKRIAEAPFPVEVVTSSGEDIAAPDRSFDSVVSTFSLCTIGDPVAALRQMRRVLKPNGRLFFLEHGRSHEPSIQRWQDRLDGFQSFVFGGCTMTREIDRLLAEAGFVIDDLTRYYAKAGPKPMCSYYRGSARPS